MEEIYFLIGLGLLVLIFIFFYRVYKRKEFIKKNEVSFDEFKYDVEEFIKQISEKKIEKLFYFYDDNDKMICSPQVLLISLDLRKKIYKQMTFLKTDKFFILKLKKYGCDIFILKMKRIYWDFAFAVFLVSAFLFFQNIF